MEFYHLRSFVVVAKTGNLTSAAKQLCTTPPAISLHIKTLEEELKTPLFVRSSKGMSLTSKGSLLLEQAEKTLNSAIDMVNLAAENQHEIMGEFTLAVNQSASRLRVPQLLNNLNENCQGISLNLTQSATGNIISNIQNGQLDGGYIYGPAPSDLHAIKVTQHNITTIAPITSPLTNEHTQIDLAKHEWITMGDYCPFDKHLRDTLKQVNTANIATHHEATRLDLVASGIGLSFLEIEETKTAQTFNQIKRLPQLDFEIDVHFVVHKAQIKSPIVKAMLQEIKILWGIKL